MNFFKSTGDKVNKIFNKNYEAERCEICFDKFSLVKFKKIHKCKRCERHVCKNCGNQKAYITDYEEKQKREHRICDECKIDKDIINNIIAGNDVRWNNNSKIGNLWLEMIVEKNQEDDLKQLQQIQQQQPDINQLIGVDCIQTQQNEIGNSFVQNTINNSKSYEQYLLEYKSQPEKFKKGAQQIKKDVQPGQLSGEGGGRSDYSVFNYSLKDFLYQVQQTIDPKDIRNSINNVLLAFIVKNPQLGYSQGMNSMAAFLLGFANEETAFLLLDHFINKIYPKNFFQLPQFNSDGISQEGWKMEEFLLKILINKQFGSNKQELQAVTDFVEMQYIFAPFMQTCMERNLNFGCMFYLWNELFTQNCFIPMEKCFVAYLDLNKSEIMQDVMSPDLKEYMLKSTKMIDLKKKMESIIITQTEKNLIIKEFYKEEYLNVRKTRNKNIIQIQLGRFLHIESEDMNALKQIFIKYCENLDQWMDVSQHSKNNNGVRPDKNDGYYITTKQFPEVYQQVFEEIQTFKKKDVDFPKKEQISQDIFNNLTLKFSENQNQSILIPNSEIENSNISVENPLILKFENFLSCIAILVQDSLRAKIKIFFKILQEIKNLKIMRNDYFHELIDLLIEIQNIFIQNNKSLASKHEISKHPQELKEFKKEITIKYSHQSGLDYSDLMGILCHPFFKSIYNNMKQNTKPQHSQNEIELNHEDSSKYSLMFQQPEEIISNLQTSKLNNSQKNSYQKQLYSGDIIAIEHEDTNAYLASNVFSQIYNNNYQNQQQQGKQQFNVWLEKNGAQNQKSQDLEENLQVNKKENFLNSSKDKKQQFKNNIVAQNKNFSSDLEWELYLINNDTSQVLKNLGLLTQLQQQQQFQQNGSENQSTNTNNSSIHITDSRSNSETIIQNKNKSPSVVQKPQQQSEFEVFNREKKSNSISHKISSITNSFFKKESVSDFNNFGVSQELNPIQKLAVDSENLNSILQDQKKTPQIIKNGDLVLLRHKKTGSFLYNNIKQNAELSANNFFISSVNQGTYCIHDILFSIQNLTGDQYILMDEQIKLSSVSNGSYLSSLGQKYEKNIYDLRQKQNLPDCEKRIEIFGNSKLIQKQTNENLKISLIKSYVSEPQFEFEYQMIHRNLKQHFQFQPIESSKTVTYRIRHLKTGKYICYNTEQKKIKVIHHQQISAENQVSWCLDIKFVKNQQLSKQKLQFKKQNKRNNSKHSEKVEDLIQQHLEEEQEQKNEQQQLNQNVNNNINLIKQEDIIQILNPYSSVLLTSDKNSYNLKKTRQILTAQEYLTQKDIVEIKEQEKLMLSVKNPYLESNIIIPDEHANINDLEDLTNNNDNNNQNLPKKVDINSLEGFQHLFKIQLLNPQKNSYLGIGSTFRIFHKGTQKNIYTLANSSSGYLDGGLSNFFNSNDQWVIEQDSSINMLPSNNKNINNESTNYNEIEIQDTF